MKKSISIILLMIGAVGAQARNPIISHTYTADPSPLVHDGRVYVYCSNDDLNAPNGWNIVEYSLVSSDDMVNWTDHGKVFNAKRHTKWAGQAYAPSCIERNGKFHLYFPNGGASIGVAVADRPEGPFVDPLGRPLIPKSKELNSDVAWCFDPCAFIDDDGQAYLYFGGGENSAHPFGKNLCVIRLNEDMISTSGVAKTIEAPNSFEAAFMHKVGGTYFFTYSTRAQEIDCMTGDQPTGGFRFRGTVLANPSIGGTNINHHSNNHAGFIKFKGQWYCFYHDRRVSNADHSRSVSVDLAAFGPGDDFKPVVVTADGPPQLKPLDPYQRIEAETIAQEHGIKTDFCSEGGQMLTGLADGDWVSVSKVDFGAGAQRFLARVSGGSGEGRIELHLGAPDGPLVGECQVPAGDWKTVRCAVENCAGVHDLFLVFRGSGELFRLNWYQFESGVLKKEGN